MGFQAFEDFEDEGMAAFIESASDNFISEQLADEEDEITVLKPMILRFAAEDADQLVVKIAGMRHHARLFAEEARAAMTPQLCGLAPEDADVLRGQLRAALETLDQAFESAHLLERFAVLALREHNGDDFQFDPEEARLEVNPPEVAPKIKLSPECQTLRRQFFAVAKKVGLVTRTEVRAARLAAVAGFVGRALNSTGDLTQAEWNSVVYAVEDGRIQW